MPNAAPYAVTHHLTIDVEDWFHLLDTDAAPPLDAWDAQPSRVEANTGRLLDLMDQFGARGTFFVLGWVAERFPALVREISRRGHEVGSHGWGHVLVHQLSRAEFAADLDRSVAAIERACGRRPLGYRAAGFSITPKVAWAFDVLAERGFLYDASVFPGGHAHGGFPGTSATPFRWRLSNSKTLWEFPVASIRWAGRPWTFGGGGYFRLLPVGATSGAMRHLERQGTPATLYLHPRDIDAEQPRVAGLSRTRHFKSYVNLGATEHKLRYLLRRYRFRSLGQGLSDAEAGWERNALPHLPVIFR